MRRIKLIWHLYPAILAIGIAVLLAAGWYTAHTFHVYYYNQIADDLQVRARMVEHQIDSKIESGRLSDVDSVCKSLGADTATRITVILPDGRVIADSDEDPAEMADHGDRPEFRAAIAEGYGKSVRFSSTVGKNMMYLAIPTTEDGRITAVVRTSVPVTLIDKELARIYQRILWAGIVLAVCAAAVSLFVSRRLTRPIEQMKDTAKRFALGDLSRSLSVPSAAELAELAGAMNEMADQLKDKIDTITRDKSQMHAILASMIEGVIAVDAEGCIITINRAAATLLDMGQAEAVGRNLEEIVRNPEFEQFVQETLRGKEPTTAAEVSVASDGQRFLQLHGTALSGGKGQRGGAVIVLHDITQIHRFEEMRRDFVANVSHELKTPITSIKGFVETLQEGFADKPEETGRFLEIIARHADRLNAIVDDLLSLSRLEEDKERRRLFFDNAYLRPVLASAVEIARLKADQKNITVELVCDEAITAKINSVLVEQAVFNLIDNAIKYSDDNSKVEVSARLLGKEVVIAVRDTGCGIDSGHLPRIFERFYVVDKGRSRKLGGTGLGLAIVKHIAQVHGGSVSVESTPGQGSTFTIHLPVD